MAKNPKKSSKGAEPYVYNKIRSRHHFVTRVLSEHRISSCSVIEMNLADWKRRNWITAHKCTKGEIADLLAIVDRDLRESAADGLTNAIGGSPSRTTQRCRRQRRHLPPQGIARHAAIIIGERSSRCR